DKEEGYGRLFNVFAMGDCGGFEGENGGVVFDDLEGVLGYYLKEKRGRVKGIPTTVNYYLLTGGEINYESYQRRLDTLVDGYCSGTKINAEEVKAKIQVNVFNEATLSSQDLTEKRKACLERRGLGAFAADSAPDVNGAYRIAVLGFGKTGQYAMEELYTHSAHLTSEKGENGVAYLPVRFIADVYDVTSDEKSGLFAYNHPLFRCIYGKDGAPLSTEEIVGRADKVGGQAFNALYGACARLGKKDEKSAAKFVEENMRFPVAVFHPQSCFAFPLMDCDRTDAMVKATKENNIRDIVVALGDDERNIAMANVVIDSFKRAFYADGACGCHVKIYVNLIERESVKRLDWQCGDEDIFSTPCKDGDGKAVQPYLSVIPFGCRNDMFSYATLIDDYSARLYSHGYDLIDQDENKAADFIGRLDDDYNAFRGNTDVSDGWRNLGQFKRKSNRSAQNFAVNYYEYYLLHGGKLTEEELAYLGRLEHERWNRFHISHGWIYGYYDRNDKPYKEMRRSMRHHDCLCAYDVMLSESTKKYDMINVRLGFIKEIVYGGNQDKKESRTDGGVND
ncbi:MAG: hypothetical protein K2L72_04985, partial [Clostridia bacterium]|nr:hypothetical protein [Clostridia bacterium]